jgi:hypothetical protein
MTQANKIVNGYTIVGGGHAVAQSKDSSDFQNIFSHARIQLLNIDSEIQVQLNPLDLLYFRLLLCDLRQSGFWSPICNPIRVVNDRIAHRNLRNGSSRIAIRLPKICGRSDLPAMPFCSGCELLFNICGDFGKETDRCSFYHVEYIKALYVIGPSRGDGNLAKVERCSINQQGRWPSNTCLCAPFAGSNKLYPQIGGLCQLHLAQIRPCLQLQSDKAATTLHEKNFYPARKLPVNENHKSPT